MKVEKIIKRFASAHAHGRLINVTTRESDSDLLWQLASLKETGEAIAGGIDHVYSFVFMLIRPTDFTLVLKILS